jgi:hypothetical protein
MMWLGNQIFHNGRFNLIKEADSLKSLIGQAGATRALPTRLS